MKTQKKIDENTFYIRDLITTELHKMMNEYYQNTRREALNEKENVMKRYFDIKTNNTAPVLVEKVTIDRIINKHGNNGFVILSANQGKNVSEKENDENEKELIKDIKQTSFTFLPVYGGYHNPTSDERDELEPSFIVFNYDRAGNSLNFDDLKAFAIEMCGKYKQHSVLIKDPNNPPIYVDKNGVKQNNTETDFVWKNDATKEFYSSLKNIGDIEKEVEDKMRGLYKSYCHKNDITPTKDGFNSFLKNNRDKIKELGRRFTFDIQFENKYYVNPSPCQLAERMSRYNEIIIWD